MLACSHRAYERLGLPLDAVIASYDRLLTAVLCLPVAVLSQWLNESSCFLAHELATTCSTYIVL